MKLIIKDENGPGQDGTFAHRGAKGGTEMMAERIRSALPQNLLDEFHIVHSRIRGYNLSEDKKNILVLHDTWDDPENDHFQDSSSKLKSKIHRLVFVSHFQQATYNIGRGIPYRNGVVLRNAIEPISFDPQEKAQSRKDTIRLIYHTTPHRGLEILVPVFQELAKNRKNIHLDVYSSFKAYNWEQRDEAYKKLFEAIDNHPQMTYHGFMSNETVREAVAKAHIFAYPCIWPETSCIAAIEALTSGCAIVTSSLGALPETTMGFANLYPYSENLQEHANVFYRSMEHTIEFLERAPDQHYISAMTNQASFCSEIYDWNKRKQQWIDFLSHLRN